jgi:hypothetical protein
MKVEILEDVLRHHDQEVDKHYDLVKGDIITVSDETGAYFCACGWATDVDGAVATAERQLNPIQINPKNAVNGHQGRGV